MKKTIYIMALMVMILSALTFAASSEDDEQALAFGQQETIKQPATNQPLPSTINSQVIIIIISIAGLWYINKTYNGGK